MSKQEFRINHRFGILAVLALSTFTVQAAITLDTNLPAAVLGQPYNSQLTATGGSGPYAFSLNSGALPTGLTLATSGAIVGTPQSAGRFTFAIQTTDSLNATLLTPFTLSVSSSSGISITNTSLPAGRINTPYDLTLTAQGGASPYAWDLLFGSGSLPPGLTLSSQGRLQGTPTTGGIYPLTLRVTDASGNSYLSSLVLRIEATALTISNTSLAGAATNVPYSQSFSAFGGTAPYTFAVTSGTLPPGLTLTSAGLLSGTPTSVGMFNFAITATDAMSATAVSNFTLMVTGAGPRIIVSSLPAGTLNQPFNASLTGQGGTPPFTFTVLSGALPAGLTLNLNGTITGTPTASGLFPVTIRIGDANSQSSQADLFIRINSGALNITTSSAPDGFVNNAYTFTFTSAGGAPPTTYSLLSGTLPAGLTLSAAGTLSGTPTAAGSYPVVIRATDASGATSQVAITFRIQSSTLQLSQSGLANGQIGQTYSSTLSATGGASPYTFNLVTGTLPTGLTFSPNGNISGTPTTSGIYQITYRVIDSNQRSAEATLPIYISGGTLNTSTLFLPAGQPNQSYQTKINVSGGTAPYNFQLATGSLPTGLTLASDGTLSGTLTQTTNGAFTIRVTDAASASTLLSYRFNVNTGTILLPTNITSTGSIGQLYSSKLSPTGASTATTYSLTSGALPPGLTLGSDGTISGTPTTAGTFIFNLQATDGATTANFSQAITITAAQLGFATTTLPAIVPSTPYSATLAGVNGSAPYTFALISGTLPTGLTLAANGSITGTTTAATGAFPVTVRITDATNNTATAVITLTVGATTPLAISTSALPSGRSSQPYNSMIMATGGTAPYTFSLLSGTLPTGLSLSVAGLISGTPTADGASTFTVQATDATGATIQKVLTLTVGSSSLLITTPQFSNGIVGRPYTSSLNASGGVAPYTFSLLSGTLPAGLTLSSAGVLSGTPTTAAASTFVIRLTDANSNSIQQSFTVNINTSTLAFINTSLPSAYVGLAYRTSLFAGAGAQPYTFSVVNGTLPAGLTLSPDGLITGTPTAMGQSTVTFRVTDASGATTDNTLTIGVIQSSATFGFTAIPSATVGQPYFFSPTGNDTSIASYVLGGLPPGISATRLGELAGVPTREGTYNVTLRIQNANGSFAVATFPLIVRPAATPVSVTP